MYFFEKKTQIIINILISNCMPRIVQRIRGYVAQSSDLFTRVRDRTCVHAQPRMRQHLEKAMATMSGAVKGTTTNRGQGQGHDGQGHD